MDFKVAHNFSDIAGSAGGIKNFFGLDNSTDVRIGFDIGLTNRLNLNVAHAKGDGHRLRPDSANSPHPQNLAANLYEITLKYQLLRQLENDPSHPVAVSIFCSNCHFYRNGSKVDNVDIRTHPEILKILVIA